MLHYFKRLNFKSKIIFSLVFLICAIAIGLVVGGLSISERTFTHRAYGETPEHRCVIVDSYACGIFISSEYGTIEVGRNSRTLRSVYSVNASGRMVTSMEPVAPTILNVDQVNLAFQSRKDIYLKDLLNGLVWGAALGLHIGLILVAVLWLCFYLLIIFERIWNPYSVGKSLSKVGSLASGGVSNLVEGIKFRSRLRQDELRARKIVAEKILKENAESSHRDSGKE